MWSIEYLRRTNFDWSGYFKGWAFIFQSTIKEDRKPLKKSTMDYLKKVEARLWY
jgi:hypothetical protein